ncbi:MAG TPA: sulfite exporter TauE/SafE family protein [Spirochaetota bacterium]
MLKEALLLGLSTGTYCARFCAPVVLPFIFSEETGRKKNVQYIGLFFAGRLIGYTVIGGILGGIGAYALGYLDPVLERKISGIAFVCIGIIMLAAGLKHNALPGKLCASVSKMYKPGGAALFLGLLTGLNLCPPFFAAASRVFMSNGGVYKGILYFAFFFIGTSVYFLPLFGVHLIKKNIQYVRMVSRLAMILLGIYFVFVLGFGYLV